MNKKVTAIATVIVVMAVTAGAYALNGNNESSNLNNKEYGSASKQHKDSKVNKEIKEVLQEFTGNSDEDENLSTSDLNEEVAGNERGDKTYRGGTVTTSSKGSNGGDTMVTVKPMDIPSGGGSSLGIITNPSNPPVEPGEGNKPNNPSEGKNPEEIKKPIDVVNPPSKPTNPGGNNGGNTGGNKGSNEENKPIIKPNVASANIINKAKSKIMEVHFVYYGVIVLQDGNISNCKFYIDGEEVIPSKVNKEGTIVKIELGRKTSRTLKVVKGSIEDTTTLRYR